MLVLSAKLFMCNDKYRRSYAARYYVTQGACMLENESVWKELSGNNQAGVISNWNLKESSGG